MPTTRPAIHPLWFHPLLLGLFPALSLLAANIDQIRLSEGYRMLTISLAAGIVVYLTARLVFRRWGSAALFASLALLLLLTYGRIYDGLKAIGLSGETIVRHRYLVPACATLLLAGGVWCASKHKTEAVNRVLNAVSLVAVAFPLVAIGIHAAGALSSTVATAGPSECTLRPPDGERLPDVYIIIMDAYERDDVLSEFHGYDNASFLDALGDLGFYVARGSLSNYVHTEQSLSSMLNMQYIQDYPRVLGTRPNSQLDIVRLINHSRVRQELECLGYITVAFETGHYWTEWEDADYYLRRGEGPSTLAWAGRISRLEYLFLETTAGRVIQDGWTASKAGVPPASLDPTVDARERILFALDKLTEVPAMPTPKLVFAHILAPHPPILFGPKGEPVNEADFETASPGPARDSPLLQAYADEVTFLNRRLLQDLRAILEGSDRTPIVILMGDHGWADRDREDKHAILNAYMVPPQAQASLDQTITPVNSFRVIFDAAFGGSYGRLEDVSYFSIETRLYDWTVVPNTWQAPLP